jgi:hypothetical protein
MELCDPLPYKTNVPAFLIGSMRSGTTLLRYLLHGHERLGCPPETKFVGGIELFLQYPQTLQALTSMGISEAELLRHIRVFVEGLYNAYLGLCGKRRCIDKTPAYYRLLPLIDQIFAKEAQFVFIVRNPLDTVFSLQQFARRFPDLAKTDPDAVRIHAIHGCGAQGWAEHWVEVYTVIERFLMSYPERSHLVRYEELVTDPASVTGDIVNFLGEHIEGLHLENALCNTHLRGFQDDKIRSTNAVHANSIGCSRTWQPELRSKVWQVVGPVAERFGYRPGCEF